jgi:hypothetical protein
MHLGNSWAKTTVPAASAGYNFLDWRNDMRKSIEEELAGAKKVSVTARGCVIVPVLGQVVVALGEGVTDDDLDSRTEEIARCCSDWEDADGLPERPDDVGEYELDDFDEARDDEPARCLIYRDAAGNIAFKKLEG